MREIKFKCYCKKHSRWEVYTLGDLVCGSACLNDGEGGIFENWSQFTGLHDKNGNEIYEGDILKINNEETMYCRYNEGYGTSEFTRSEKLLGHTVEGLFRRYDVSTLIFEVIGNVWEDKELLKPRKIEEQEVLVSDNPELLGEWLNE